MINSRVNKESIVFNRLNKGAIKPDLLLNYVANRESVKFPFKGYVISINGTKVILIKDCTYILGYHLLSSQKYYCNSFKIGELLADSFYPAYRLSKEEYSNWSKILSS